MKIWLERKKAALCILAGVCALSIFIIFDSDKKLIENQGDSYVVKIRHYGIDAEEMERSVTIPLEDALFAIPGVLSVQSSSENSLSSVFIRFKPFRNKQGRYEAVRDATQKIYETLPSSAQRPEILSTNNSRVPVWSCTSYINTAHILDRIVKPRLESLEGAGEVIVSGVGNKQIFIILDQEKLSSIGLEPVAVASALGMNDSVFSGGSILQTNLSLNTAREIIVTVDGRYNQSLGSALIPLGDGKFAELSDIAVITEREREPDILSRLNGRKTAGIAIMSRDGANLQKLSLDIKKELASPDLSDLEFIVLSDLGAEEAKAYRSVLNAALSGSVMVALICFLLNANNLFTNLRHEAILRGGFCALTIPIICLVSIAFLSIGGFSVNRLMLAGIAAGVGTAVDSVILSAERLRCLPDRLACNRTAAADALKKLAGPLIAGAATTTAALLPLARIQEESVKVIAVSIAVVCVTSLVISLTLLPPLLLWDIKTKSNQLREYPYKNLRSKWRLLLRKKIALSRRIFKLLAANVKFCTRYPALVLGAALALTLAAVFALINKGVDTASYGSEDSIYAQVEFEGGLLAEEADRLLAAYGAQLSDSPGIKNVETGARTGSGSLLISFDPKVIQMHHVRNLAKQIPIPGGFVFFHENSNHERYWEIKIYGDEIAQCMKIAEELAYISTSHPIVRDTVLNFKQGSKKLILLPDRDIFAETGISFSNAANKIRSGVYGPVAYKRMSSSANNENEEIDVRILYSGYANMRNNPSNAVLRQSRKDTLNLLVSGRNGVLHTDTLMKKHEETELSNIRRDDRRRTASVTITTEPMDPRRARKELMSVFGKIDLPPGYSVEFDPAKIEQAQNISATVLSLVMAVLFCYMIIASINESFTVPLIVLAAIPSSLSIPALCLAFFGSAYNLAIACAFIAVSGMTVNAAVLCADELAVFMRHKKQLTTLNIYLALRKKLPALLATTATTAAGAVPFLFLKEGSNTLIRTLSLVGALGVTCSCICSMTVIPSLFIFFNFLKHRKCKH